ncbi:MAG: hypothetical protein KAI47_23030 [Deltaproteobacteria bacterium]|nr:hypothetical protein [Deltaproteobacteria bacterium]
MSSSAQSSKLAPPAWPGDRARGGLVERIVFVLILVLIATGAAFVFLGAIGAVNLTTTFPYGAELEKIVFFSSLPTGIGRLLATAVSGAIGLLALVVLLRRFSGGNRRPEAKHVLVSDERGFVVIEKRGISTVAVSAIKRVHGVVNAEVTVVGGGSAPVRLVIRAWIHAGAELTVAGEKVRQAAITAVETLVGLEVHDVMVKVEVVPLEDLDRLIQ